MLGIADLSQEIPDIMVERFVQHLSAVVGHYGVEALTNYVDPKADALIQGRLFYKIDAVKDSVPFTIKMDLKDIRFSDDLGTKFDILTKNGKEFDDFYNAVGARLVKNTEFNGILADFKALHPDKDVALSRFFAAQSGYVILENIIRQRSENSPATSDYKNTDRNIKLNTKKIKAIEHNKENKKMVETIKHINSDMEKKMPALTQKYRELGAEVNRTLMRGRLAIEHYTHQQPGVSSKAKL